MVNLLYADTYKINEHIEIVIPTVGDVIDNSDEYYTAVTALTSMPIDLMAQLDDIGIDFSEITDYDLFLLMFNGLVSCPCINLIFKDLDLSKFQLALDERTNMMVLIDTENDIKIDMGIYHQIALTLRTIHGLKKNMHKPGNEEAKKYLLERAHIKARRKNRRNNGRSELESLIIAMVNTEQFKYNFQSVRELSIYQFNESVKQVIKKIDYDNTMHGVFSGTVNIKDLKQNELNWLTNK